MSKFTISTFKIPAVSLHPRNIIWISLLMWYITPIHQRRRKDGTGQTDLIREVTSSCQNLSLGEEANTKAQYQRLQQGFVDMLTHDYPNMCKRLRKLARLYSKYQHLSNQE